MCDNDDGNEIDLSSELVKVDQEIKTERKSS